MEKKKIHSIAPAIALLGLGVFPYPSILIITSYLIYTLLCEKNMLTELSVIFQITLFLSILRALSKNIDPIRAFTLLTLAFILVTQRILYDQQ